MNSKTTRQFRLSLAGLPVEVRRAAMKAYHLFRQNPQHPSVQFKKIQGYADLYSARVNLNYRVVGRLSDDVIIWFFIGTHAEYEKLLD